jgi:hypothetical protein
MEALPRSPVIAESAIGAVFLAERLAQLRRAAPALKSQAP